MFLGKGICCQTLCRFELPIFHYDGACSNVIVLHEPKPKLFQFSSTKHQKENVKYIIKSMIINIVMNL